MKKKIKIAWEKFCYLKIKFLYDFKKTYKSYLQKKTINFKIKSIHRKQMSLQNINMHEVGRQQIGNKNANLILNA